MVNLCHRYIYFKIDLGHRLNPGLFPILRPEDLSWRVWFLLLLYLRAFLCGWEREIIDHQCEKRHFLDFHHQIQCIGVIVSHFSQWENWTVFLILLQRQLERNEDIDKPHLNVSEFLTFKWSSSKQRTYHPMELAALLPTWKKKLWIWTMKCPKLCKSIKSQIGWLPAHRNLLGQLDYLKIASAPGQGTLWGGRRYKGKSPNRKQPAYQNRGL